MDSDLALIVGIVIGGFTIPSIVSSISDSRAPRVAMIMVLVAGALILYALVTKPGGYTVREMPDVFFGVISRFTP